MPTIYRQVTEALRSDEDQRGLDRTIYLRDVLRRLERKCTDNELTLAGGLLKTDLGLSEEELSHVLWINIELAEPNTRRENRMWPIAMRSADVGSIVDTHTRLFGESFEKYHLATSDWITLSHIIDEYGKKGSEIKHFLFCLTDCNVSSDLAGYHSFKNIFIIAKRNGNFCLRNGTDVNQDPDYSSNGSRKIEPFVEWLATFNLRPPLIAYLGCEYPETSRDIRIWAGLSTVSAAAIRAVRYFGETIHNNYLDVIRSQSSTRLETLWRRTKGMAHDAINRGEAEDFVREFITPAIYDLFFPGHDEQEIVRRWIRGLCGAESHAFIGNDSFTMGGAFLLFLGALASTTTPAEYQEIVELHNDVHPVSMKPALPAQSDGVAKAAMKAMFEMFQRFVWNDKSGTLSLSKAVFHKGGLRMELKFNPYEPEYVGSERTFVSAIANAIASDGNGSEHGKTSEAIYRFFVHSHIADKQGSVKEGRFFPPGAKLELAFHDGMTIVEIKPN